MNKRNKFLSVLLVILMLATAVPGFFAPVAALNLKDIQITDGNDNVFMSGENVTIYFWTEESGLTENDITFSNISGIVTNSSHTLEKIKSKVEGTVTYYNYKLDVKVSGHGILRVKVSEQILADLYVYELDNWSVYSVGANETLAEGKSYNLLINDQLVIKANITGPEVPEGYTEGTGLPTPNQTEIHVPGLGDVILDYVSGTTWNFTKTFTLSQVGNFTLNLTNGMGINFTQNINITVLEPDFELFPINNGTAEQNFVKDANLTYNDYVANLSFNYTMKIKLTDGINWTTLGNGTEVNNTLYETTNNTLDFFDGANVTVINGTLGEGNITIEVPELGIVWTKSFIILGENEPASMEVNETEVVVGEHFKIDLAITDPGWGENTKYNLTLVYAANSSYKYYVDANVSVTNEYKTYDVNTSEMFNTINPLPVGLYNVTFFMSNGTKNFQVTTPITITEELTLSHEEPPVEWGAYYPNDTVTFEGTFLRVDQFNTSNVQITVYQMNASEEWEGAGENATVANFNSNVSAGTYNFTVTFHAPGKYKVLVEENDTTNVQAFDIVEIAEHTVELSEPSASIPIGTTYKIQVTTTYNETLTINAPEGIENVTVVDKEFNATTHLKVFNVTFTANESAELGDNIINITVPYGENKFTLTVTDEMNITYAPTKVVLGSNATLILETNANLTNDAYSITVWAFGVDETPVNVNVTGEEYNATTLSRTINMTFNVNQSIYSKDPVTYPTHYMNITDGHTWTTTTFEIVEDPELYIEPVGDVIVGQNITFKGTTLLAPGELVTINITSEVLGNPHTDTATVELDTSRDENTFEFSYKFTVPGLYNVTVNWSNYKSNTIQVNVLSEDVLTISTDREDYYPDGMIKVTGQLGDVTEEEAIMLKFYWIGGNYSTTEDLVNGTYESYFNMTGNLTSYSGDLVINATYKGYANATKTVTIVDTPTIENVVVPTDPVEAGTVFNITADTNLGINGTVALKIVKADNATDVKVNEPEWKVGEGGAFTYEVNTTDWTAGYYNVTLSKSTVKVEKQFYVYVVGANISLVEDSLVVDPTEGVTPLTINVKANVTNTGDLEGEYTAVFYVNGDAVKNTTVTVPFGETVTVEFTYTLEEAGVYNVTIGDLTPVQVTALAPASISVKNMSVDKTEGVVPFTVAVNVTLINTGDVAGDYEVKVYLDDAVANSTTVTVEPGEESVILNVEVTEAGEHVIKVDSFNETVTALAPAKFVLSNLTVDPTEGVAPLEITASAIVENVGDVEGTYTAVLYVDNKAVANKTVEVLGKSSEVVEFNYTIETIGEHTVTIGDLTPVTVTVLEPAKIKLIQDTFEVTPTEGVAPFNITAKVYAYNTGGVAGNYTAVLYVDGEAVANKTVEVAPEESVLIKITYEFSEDMVGVHNVTIDGLTPVQVTVLKPAKFVLSNLTVDPTEGVAPLEITASAIVENVGDVEGTFTVEFKVNNEVVDSVNVTLGGGEEAPVEFAYTIEEPGTYNVTIGDLTPVQVTALAPASISITNLTIDPSGEVVFEEPFNMTINVTLENTGDVAGDYTVLVTVNAEELTKNVTVEPGTMVVTFEYEITEPGLYVVKAGDFEKSLNVTEKTGLVIYKERVASAENVYITFKDYTSMDYAVSVPYITPTIQGVSPKFKFAKNFVSELGNLTANDVVISIGGPLVNDVTAYYEDIAPVHMVVGENITIVTPEGNFTWTPPKPWWNATEGYFIIQLFEDPDTSALIVTIYGTDMDSTAAGAYYFANEIYPNLDSYSGVDYIVGLWEDTEHGADYELPGADQGDDSGFSSGDSITIVAQG